MSAAAMVLSAENQSIIIQTERGLTISGTRISLYDVMTFLKKGYPPAFIQNKLHLTQQQFESTLAYIEANSAQVEQEYRAVLDTRQEIQQYWSDRNAQHFQHIASRSKAPEQVALWAKLEAEKAQRLADNR